MQAKLGQEDAFRELCVVAEIRVSAIERCKCAFNSFPCKCKMLSETDCDSEKEREKEGERKILKQRKGKRERERDASIP